MKIEIKPGDELEIVVSGVATLRVDPEHGVSIRPHRAKLFEGPLPFARFEKACALFTDDEPESKPAESTLPLPLRDPDEDESAAQSSPVDADLAAEPAVVGGGTDGEA